MKGEEYWQEIERLDQDTREAVNEEAARRDVPERLEDTLEERDAEKEEFPAEDFNTYDYGADD